MSGYPSYPLHSATEPPEPARLGPGRLAIALAFGVALPVACLALDPIVFRSSDALLGPLGTPLLGSFRVVGYTATGVGIASLVTWLAVRRPAALMAGLLAGGAVFALCLAVVLLPYSLLGLGALVGALGFVPFGTAGVFARQAQDSWRAVAGRRGAVHWAAAGFLAACGVPWGLQVAAWAGVRSATEAAASDDPAEAAQGARRLGWLWFAADPDELVWAYGRERDPDRRRGLADAYRRLTGRELEDRLTILRD